MNAIRSRLKIAVIACTCSLLISGCAGKVRYPNYYTLSIPSAPSVEQAAVRPPATLAVRQFQTPAYLRQGRIVYREHQNRIGFYEYHRWASDPGPTVTTAVIDSLRSSHLFISVGAYVPEGRSDYLLTGRIERLDEIDSGDGVKVEARLTAELSNLRTGTIVWTGDASEISNVDRRNVNSVVEEMSTAVQISIQRLLAGMLKQFANQETATR